MTRKELKDRRLRLAWSRRELGKRLGVTAMCVYYWEKGRRPIPQYLELALETLERKHGKGVSV